MRDQLNRKLQLNSVPKRIISLVPSQTELLCDLGLENSIVGVTKFCVHPNHIKTNVTVVGGTKQIHIDKIRALKPDIILCNKEENTKEIVEICASISNVHVSDIYSVKDSLELINQYGTIFNVAEAANNIVEDINTKVDDFKGFICNRIVLQAVYFIWKDPWMVVANNTFINYILNLNKFKNIYETKIRYPEIELKTIAKNSKIDVILLSSEPYPFKEKHVKELREFFPKTTIVLVDGEMFSWYGSRLTKAFQYFKSLRLNLEKRQSY